MPSAAMSCGGRFSSKDPAAPLLTRDAVLALCCGLSVRGAVAGPRSLQWPCWATSTSEVSRNLPMRGSRAAGQSPRQHTHMQGRHQARARPNGPDSTLRNVFAIGGIAGQVSARAPGVRIVAASRAATTLTPAESTMKSECSDMKVKSTNGKSF